MSVRNLPLACILQLQHDAENATGGRLAARLKVAFDHEHPLVDPQVSHFRQVPLRTIVKFAHSGQETPS